VKAYASRFTVCPVWPLRNPPCMSRRGRLRAGARLKHYAFDDDFFQGKVVAVGGQAADFLEMLKALQDAAEDGVLAIECGNGFECDVELAAVGNAGGIDFVVEARGRHGATFVGQADFGRNGPTRSTGPGAYAGAAPAVGVAGLHQGAGEGTVELHAPVVAGADQFLEILGVQRGSAIVQPDDDTAEVAFFTDFEIHDDDIRSQRLRVERGGEQEAGKDGEQFHRGMICGMRAGGKDGGVLSLKLVSLKWRGSAL